MSENIQRSMYISPDIAEEINRYAISQNICTNEAVRRLLKRGLSLHTIGEEQDTVRKYIRDELNIVIPMILKPFMDKLDKSIERIIKMQANSTRSSAAALLANVFVIGNTFADEASCDEILANCLKLSTNITRTKQKTDAEYLNEARQWLGTDVTKPKDY